MPDRMSECMSDGMSDRMSECMPDRMPDRMSECMSERMPDRMSEYLSDKMSFVGDRSKKVTSVLWKPVESMNKRNVWRWIKTY